MAAKLWRCDGLAARHLLCREPRAEAPPRQPSTRPLPHARSVPPEATVSLLGVTASRDLQHGYAPSRIDAARRPAPDYDRSHVDPSRAVPGLRRLPTRAAVRP